MLHKAVSQYEDLEVMALIRGVDDFSSLMEFIEDFENDRTLYSSIQTGQAQSITFMDENSGLQTKIPRLLVRPDTFVPTI